MKYVLGNFFVQRIFDDHQDMTSQLRQWTHTYANQRIHSVTKTVPWDQLVTTERSCLQPLPQTPYATFERAVRHVSFNCHIFFRNNYYSVPSRFVGQTVIIRFSEHLLRVVAGGEEVALHSIAAGAGQYVTKRSHLPEYKCYGETEYQKKYEEKMADIGEHAHAYFREVLIKQHAYWFQSVRSIVGLPMSLAMRQLI